MPTITSTWPKSRRATSPRRAPATGCSTPTSVILTLAAFWAVSEHIIYGPAIPIALITLAIAQMGVHLVFFLHVTTGPDNTNNVLALAFGVLVVFLVVGGSIWIMSNLNTNMMPMNQLMQMQP